jgi:hypothetical protein
MLGRGATIPRDSGAQIGELLGMSLVALDSAKLFILMAAGGSFAIAGLWLLLRPKPAGGARIELFGMKFESSSAGLLVFLIGAGFIATPLFVPQRAPVVVPSTAASIPSGTGGPSVPGVQIEAATPTVPRRARAAGREREPNDNYDDANQVAVGESWAGVFNSIENDWFALTTDGTAVNVYLKIRSVSGDQCELEWIDFYTAGEMRLGDQVAFPPAYTVTTTEVPASGEDVVFMHLDGHSTFDCKYEIFTSYTPFQ